MNYNKKKQPFTILSRFRILEEVGEVEYCRVRFYNTGFITNIRAGLVKTNDFEDESLITEEPEEVIEEEIVEDIEEVIELIKQEGLIIDSELKEPETLILATNPDGEEMLVEDLEAFAVEHNLDVEAVESCLEGKQKTHRKWRFTTV